MIKRLWQFRCAHTKEGVNKFKLPPATTIEVQSLNPEQIIRYLRVSKILSRSANQHLNEALIVPT